MQRPEFIRERYFPRPLPGWVISIPHSETEMTHLSRPAGARGEPYGPRAPEVTFGAET
jgi:hypothetical protein